MALLHLLGRVAPGRKRIAAIVDHGLRAESAAEAKRAADLARGLGAEPHILTLDWPDGAKGSQDAARTARHEALAVFARRQGVSVIYLGHTRDDQAETVAMRRDRTSGGAGLSGMGALAPSPVWPEGRDLWIARPMLGLSRERLREVLKDDGIGWIEDPSNAALRFARVRTRARLRESGETDDLIRLAKIAAAETADAHRRAMTAALMCATFEDGVIRFAEELLDLPAAVDVLAAAAMAVGARTRELPSEAAAGLARRLTIEGTTALGGALFSRVGARILVVRDPGGVHGRRGGGRPHPRLDLAPGVPVVWDRRLEVTAPEPGWALVRSPGLKQTDPVFLQGGQAADPGPLTRRWLAEHRFRRRFWRHGEPVLD